MSGLLHAISKWIGRQIEGPSQYARQGWIATLSVVEVLLELVDSRFLEDINRLKEHHFKVLNAQADGRRAEADKLMAEAAVAANEANLHKRKDAVAKLKKREKEAAIAKTEAEAEAIRFDAETRRLAAIAEGKAKLIESILKLRQEDGDFYVNVENLLKLPGMEMPPLIDSPGESEEETPDSV